MINARARTRDKFIARFPKQREFITLLYERAEGSMATHIMHSLVRLGINLSNRTSLKSQRTLKKFRKCRGVGVETFEMFSRVLAELKGEEVLYDRETPLERLFIKKLFPDGLGSATKDKDVDLLDFRSLARNLGEKLLYNALTRIGRQPIVIDDDWLG